MKKILAMVFATFAVALPFQSEASQTTASESSCRAIPIHPVRAYAGDTVSETWYGVLTPAQRRNFKGGYGGFKSQWQQILPGSFRELRYDKPWKVPTGQAGKYWAPVGNCNLKPGDKITAKVSMTSDKWGVLKMAPMITVENPNAEISVPAIRSEPKPQPEPRTQPNQNQSQPNHQQNPSPAPKTEQATPSHPTHQETQEQNLEKEVPKAARSVEASFVGAFGNFLKTNYEKLIAGFFILLVVLRIIQMILLSMLVGAMRKVHRVLDDMNQMKKERLEQQIQEVQEEVDHVQDVQKLEAAVNHTARWYKLPKDLNTKEAEGGIWLPNCGKDKDGNDQTYVAGVFYKIRNLESNLRRKNELAARLIPGYAPKNEEKKGISNNNSTLLGMA
ncbi:MAG TPA: hypothetical protein VFM02_00535 [Candidatus Paceibacterota bacterium]|nr:hypothetical protein [Candidatus Paceibacterota bacterium]